MLAHRPSSPLGAGRKERPCGDDWDCKRPNQSKDFHDIMAHRPWWLNQWKLLNCFIQWSTFLGLVNYCFITFTDDRSLCWAAIQCELPLQRGKPPRWSVCDCLEWNKRSRHPSGGVKPTRVLQLHYYGHLVWPYDWLHLRHSFQWHVVLVLVDLHWWPVCSSRHWWSQARARVQIEFSIPQIELGLVRFCQKNKEIFALSNFSEPMNSFRISFNANLS